VHGSCVVCEGVRLRALLLRHHFISQDTGSTGNGCCSGALFFLGGFNGISTASAQTGVWSDDNPLPGPAVVTLLDFAGSNVSSRVAVCPGVPPTLTTHHLLLFALTILSTTAMKTCTESQSSPRLCMAPVMLPCASMVAPPRLLRALLARNPKEL
jgi:hypothetical protein